MIVPYTPGSPVDVLARVVSQQVSARLGHTIVLDNRPGAGLPSPPSGGQCRSGRLHAHDRATSFIIAATLYPHIDYDPIKNFTPSRCWRSARRCS